VLFYTKNGSETNLYCIYRYKIHIKYTNKQSLGGEGVGMAFALVPTEKALWAYRVYYFTCSNLKFKITITISVFDTLCRLLSPKLNVLSIDIAGKE